MIGRNVESLFVATNKQVGMQERQSDNAQNITGANKVAELSSLNVSAKMAGADVVRVAPVPEASSDECLRKPNLSKAINVEHFSLTSQPDDRCPLLYLYAESDLVIL